MVSMKISFIILFFILGCKFAFVRLLSFIVYYIMNTVFHVSHALQDHVNRPYFHMSAADRVSDSKVFVAIPSSPSVKVFRMDIDSEIF
jgi:hypothetical protein